jgi:hypothetical protein
MERNHRKQQETNEGMKLQCTQRCLVVMKDCQYNVKMVGIKAAGGRTKGRNMPWGRVKADVLIQCIY